MRFWLTYGTSQKKVIEDFLESMIGDNIMDKEFQEFTLNYLSQGFNMESVAKILVLMYSCNSETTKEIYARGLADFLAKAYLKFKEENENDGENN